MVGEFNDQGGAATMDPSALVRWIQSKIMTAIIKNERLEKKRERAEKQRRVKGRPHTIEYFHQVDDGYSHLAVQLLQLISARYNVEIRCHLVEGPTGDNVADANLLLQLSRYDSSLIADYYGLSFPESISPPENSLLTVAKSILSNLSDKQFVDEAQSVSEALWSGDSAALEALSQRLGTASDEETVAKLSSGSKRQADLAHYSGAMFYYGGEWYWSVDRLYHLEVRLAALKLDRHPDNRLIAARPDTTVTKVDDQTGLTLEIYPSLRSPYTAIVFDRTIQFAKDCGISLVVRPVLPMVMRGVPATRIKGMYIFKDTMREAIAEGQSFGRFYDPIGNPVRRCYSLYPWACSLGLGNELISSFLNAAFVQGINTNNDKGLQKVVENAGLDWQEANQIVGTSTGWEEILEANRLAMYEHGLWGVPSYRLLDSDNNTVLAVWGQDRLWLVAKKINELFSDD